MENKYIESCVFTLDNSHKLSLSVLVANYYPPIDISDGSNMKHISDTEVDIFHIKSVGIHCPIAIGKRVNSTNTNIIYDFYIDVDAGYDIIEKPINNQYYPVIDVDKIPCICLEFKHQKGLLIDFRNEYIEATVQIRKVLSN